MARTRTLALAAAAAAALIGGTAALAHHGWSTYTVDDFTLEGTITEVRFGNPHDRLTVDVEGVAWDVWLTPPGRHRNFDATKVNIGDTVIAYGERHMDENRNEMKTARLTVRNADGEVVYDLYPDRIPS
jgi:hypothetical protein